MFILAQSKFALDQLGDSGARLQMTVIWFLPIFCLQFLGWWPKRKSMQHLTLILDGQVASIYFPFSPIFDKKAGVLEFSPNLKKNYIKSLFDNACTGWGRVVSVLTIFLPLQRKINPQDKVRREKQNRPNIFQLDEMWTYKAYVKITMSSTKYEKG